MFSILTFFTKSRHDRFVRKLFWKNSCSKLKGINKSELLWVIYDKNLQEQFSTFSKYHTQKDTV